MRLSTRQGPIAVERSESFRQSELGLTLIECLVAIIVIALTTAMIAPMMVFSVATRVQNQKTEQALQLAQSEIDKVRLIVEQGGDYGDELSFLQKISDASVVFAADAPAPNSFIASTDTVGSVTEAKKIDFDNDGDDDFAIQTFRTTGVEVPVSGGTPVPVRFQMGVRVYDARAERNISAPLGTESAGLTFTSGEGERGTKPLAVLYSGITQGDRPDILCEYWVDSVSNPTAEDSPCP